MTALVVLIAIGCWLAVVVLICAALHGVGRVDDNLADLDEPVPYLPAAGPLDDDLMAVAEAVQWEERSQAAQRDAEIALLEGWLRMPARHPGGAR